jgi:hypothetical protein
MRFLWVRNHHGKEDSIMRVSIRRLEPLEATAVWIFF